MALLRAELRGRKTAKQSDPLRAMLRGKMRVKHLGIPFPEGSNNTRHYRQLGRRASKVRVVREDL